MTRIIGCWSPWRFSGRCIVLVASLTPAPVLLAQAPAPAASILPPARMKEIGDSLTPGASRTAQLAKGPGYTYAVTHRDTSGGVEVHDAWTDIFVIQTGSAAMLTGGVAEKAVEATPGEWRGGVIRGGTSAAVQPGDVVVIPAGTPHQMVLRAGERITYLAIKVAAPPAKP